MTSAQFQGSAKSTPFAPLQAPDLTGAMRQQLDDQLRWMREDQQMIISDRRQYAAAMDQQMQTARGFNDKNLEALAGMSKTLTDTLLRMKKDRGQDQMEEGLMLFYQYGLPLEQAQKFDEDEKKLTEARDKTNEYADKIARSGAPPEVVEQIRSLSGWKRYGYLTGLAQDAGLKWGEYLQEALANDDQTQVDLGNGQIITPSQAQDKAQMAAVSAVLRKKYLREMGLTGTNPALLNKYLFPNMRQGEDPVISQRYRGLVAAKARETIDEQDSVLATGLMSQGGAATAFNSYVSNLRSIVDPKSGQLLGPAGARDRAFDVIARLAQDGAIAESAITEIEQSLVPGSTNETWGTKFRLLFTGLRDRIREGKEADLAAKDREEARADKEKVKQIIAFAEQKGGLTELEKEEIRKSYQEAGKLLPSELENLLTVEQVNDKAARKYLDGLLAQGRGISEQELMSGGYSNEIINSYRGRIREFETNITKNETFKANIQALNQDLLNLTLRGTSQGARPHWTLELAKAEARSLLQMETLKNIRTGMQPDAAANAALVKVSKLIQDGQPTAKGPGSGPFAVAVDKINPSVPLTNGGFVGVLNKLGQARQMSQQKAAEFNNIVQNLKKYRKRAFDMPLLGQDDLNQLERLRRDPSQSFPSSVLYLSQQSRTLSPWDVADKQLQAAGRQPLTRPPEIQWSDTIDPRLRQLLNFAPSYNRTMRAYSGTPWNISKVPRNYGAFIEQSAKRNGIDPALLAGLLHTENTPFDPNTVNASSGAVGLAQVLPSTGAEVGITDLKNPAQNIEAGARYLRKMLDMFNGDVTAALRAYNQGPGAQQRFPGGNSRESREYPGKVLRAAASYGYGFGAGSPFRRPELMTPSLVYRIGSLGYGSNGPHLDVKPVQPGSLDGRSGRSLPAYRAGMLDQYVMVKVNGKLVPLSKGAPTSITSSGRPSDDTAHRNRGSFGHDYAAPAGTEVYLRNGARVVGTYKGDGGTDHTIIELPDGRRFQFLHGTNAKG